jgi:hypothetical protein
MDTGVKNTGVNTGVIAAVTVIAILVLVAAYAAYRVWTEPAVTAQPEPQQQPAAAAVAKAVTTTAQPEPQPAPQPEEEEEEEVPRPEKVPRSAEPRPQPKPQAKPQAKAKPGGAPVVAGRWGPEVADEVERYYMQRLRADKTLAIEPKRLVTSGSSVTITTFMPPKTPDEKIKIAFIQRQIMRMLALLKRSYATDKRAQNLLANYGGKVGSAVFSDKQILGVMSMKINTKAGKVAASNRVESAVMAVNISLRIALLMNVIAHEMAHASVKGKYDMVDKPPNDYGSGQQHGPNHTAAWKWLLGIGIKAGWQFVEFPGASTCRQFRLCNPRTEIPGAKNVVFSSTVPMGGETV